jgi:hypothetical protein
LKELERWLKASALEQQGDAPNRSKVMADSLNKKLYSREKEERAREDYRFFLSRSNVSYTKVLVGVLFLVVFFWIQFGLAILGR